MARSRDRSGHNYYLPFIELLDLEVDEADLITAYGESIPDLWTMLQWWLDEKHSGQLGFSTIVSDSHFTRIGYDMVMEAIFPSILASLKARGRDLATECPPRVGVR